MDLLSMGKFIWRLVFSTHPPQAQFIIGLVPLEARASYFVLSDKVSKTLCRRRAEGEKNHRQSFYLSSVRGFSKVHLRL